jgi:hypothetical protein
MDYDKTYMAYKNLGHEKKFEQLPDYPRYKKEKAWDEKCKSPRTSEFYQADDLIKRELVPASWKPPRTDSKGKPVKYPIKEVSEIIRKRLPDGTEWILSRQMWTGLDQVGNELNLSIIDPEMYNDVLPVYALKPENPKDNPNLKTTKMISVIDRLEKRIKYTEPFTAEKAQKLYDMRNGKCSLCVIDESGSDHPPVNVPSFESFMNSSFTELFELVTTPKYKMEPSSTQEYQKQYG